MVLEGRGGSRWNNRDGTVGEWDVYRRVFVLLLVDKLATKKKAWFPFSASPGSRVDGRGADIGEWGPEVVLLKSRCCSSGYHS